MTATATATVSTPAAVVPTPRGFVQAAALITGDLVFGSDGRPTAVVSVGGWTTDSAIAIGFCDGASALAAPEQLWLALDGATATEGYYRSGDIAATLALPDGTARWSVSLTAPVAYPDTGPAAEDPLTFGEQLRDGLVESESELPPYLLSSVEVRRAVLRGLLGAEDSLSASAPGLATAACASLVRSLGGQPRVETASSGDRIVAAFGARRYITSAGDVDQTAPGGLTVAAADGQYLTGGDYVLSCGTWRRR